MLIAFVYIICVLVSGVECHGRLLQPPGRSTAWRFGYSPVENNDDNQLFCGGFSTLKENKGKCGVCGDNYKDPQPRANEAGGKYAPINRRIVKCIGGPEPRKLDVVVQITASHFGFFEFRLCPNNNMSKIVTQECLDRHLLTVSATGERKYYPVDKSKDYMITLDLPLGMTCQQCVLQWRYKTGNSWGTAKNGTSCVGCGFQEEFYACSDIRIASDCNNSQTDQETVKPTSATKPTTTKQTTKWPAWPTTTKTPTTTTTTPTTKRHTTTTSAKTTTTNKPLKSCKPVESTETKEMECYAKRKGYEEWCKAYGEEGYCPSAHCTVTQQKEQECVAIGRFAGQNGMDEWCNKKCKRGKCPSKRCKCSFAGKRKLESNASLCKGKDGMSVYDDFCGPACEDGDPDCSGYCEC